MAFNYEKHKAGHSNDSFWTSYSDLFLGLSTIFLLLYVVSSLRTGTDALRGQVENQKLSMQVEELQHQLKMYESVKNEYMKNEAAKDEVQEYQELMDKLTLLQEDTKNEKDRLVKEALENETKVKALNKYQQMVRNVLNANKLAKTKIITRDNEIKEQDTEITAQEGQISELQKDIDSKKQLIAENQQEIADTQATLQHRMNDLRAALKRNKINQAAFAKKAAAMKAESNAKIAEINRESAKIQTDLATARNELGQAQGDLQRTKGMLAQKEGENQGLKGQLGEAQGQLSNTKGQLNAVQGKLANTAGELEATKGALGHTRGALDAARGQLADARGKLGATEGELNATKGALGATKGALDATRGKLAATEGELNSTKGALGETQGQLAKARAEIEARKSVAHEIQKGFAKAGVKADIDMQTGDVVLDFGQQYFDSDSDRLKNEMKGVIEKAMPIYSRSLFGNPKVSEKISSVEIVGFASPTYKGRYVDPRSSKPEDKQALKYNMDLSYRRANSIFSYMLDERNVSFDHQRELMARMKVSGRSFLEVMKVQDRNVATAAEFCRQNDCKKAQRVIIRFSMDQKK